MFPSRLWRAKHLLTSDVGAYPKNLNAKFTASWVFFGACRLVTMSTAWDAVEFLGPFPTPVDGFFAAGKHGVEIFFVIAGSYHRLADPPWRRRPVPDRPRHPPLSRCS